MKKIAILIFICFMFIGNANAETIEEQLNSLKSRVANLEEKVNNNENNRLDKTYPIGSIFETTVYSTPSEVSNALGGTWEVYGSGKTLVGIDTSDEDFNAVNKTGGSASTTLSISNLPSHSHDIPSLSGSAASAGAHTHSIPALSGTAASAGAHTHSLNSGLLAFSAGQGNIHNPAGTSIGGLAYMGFSPNTGSSGSHSHTVTTTASTTGSNGAHTHNVSTVTNTSGSIGSGTSFTNLQPYITVYRYQRVA